LIFHIIYTSMKLSLKLRSYIIIVISSFVLGPVFAQTLTNPGADKHTQIATGKNIISRPTTIEICDNHIDDDNNGLTDLKDFYCYFNRPGNNRCVPMKVIWAAGYGDLRWVDLETGTEHYVGDINNRSALDIAWASNGKLYGVEDNRIFEIDPNTNTTTYLTDVQGYVVVNSMTADAFGNLYVAAITGVNQSSLVKINLATLQQTLVTSLNGFVPGGDLTYYDGALYLICASYELVKITFNPINFTVTKLVNSPTDRPYGITNIGDGFLYISHENSLYKLNPVTMIVDGTPAYSFTSPFSINGLCSYSESCFSKDCKANVSISVNSIIPQPYCSEYGVTLSATGTGIAGQSSYTWKLPDGSTVNGPELFATQNGKYIASYHTVPDTCGREDSVTLAFISGCENKLFVPAAFTPNGDNRNDLFKPAVFGLVDLFELQLYNRYGQLLFRTDKILQGWDGTFKNKPQGLGSYAWVLRYRFKGSNIIQYESGSVLLLH